MHTSPGKANCVVLFQSLLWAFFSTFELAAASTSVFLLMVLPNVSVIPLLLKRPSPPAGSKITAFLRLASSRRVSVLQPAEATGKIPPVGIMEASSKANSQQHLWKDVSGILSQVLHLTPFQLNTSCCCCFWDCKCKDNFVRLCQEEW